MSYVNLCICFLILPINIYICLIVRKMGIFKRKVFALAIFKIKLTKKNNAIYKIIISYTMKLMNIISIQSSLNNLFKINHKSKNQKFYTN